MDFSDRASIICRAIRRAILEQALSPGDKLPEDTLGERFGVSRTIARHALGQLASEGLVELRRNRIALVATPSFEEARDEFDIRRELERLVVRALCGRLSASQIEELTAHVAGEEAARGGSEANSIRLATEFHVKLAEMTGKPTLTRYVREIAYRSSLSLATFGRPHSPDCAISEHRAVIEAVAAGDAERAAALMAEHLDQVAARAFLKARPSRGDLMEVLAPYADAERPGLGARAGRETEKTAQPQSRRPKHA
ncbi:GntR family transcriptional regulator [Mangrovibrevibacter kandeliae]|uniref:GntR family transcriptional regulator n=1 Tax=Mangrovibrevibacter kandeliae TaxID=2968473 RepID=UPI002117E1EC|nr:MULTISPECIES: GntR family transcriptional regulator [unclassified Aurantimonas]MCQ8782883.1 GntR family transcriptional regulator [Aurantimonas sp. CSK15Z-1]MCW4115894.1 GntR family transcriptional regulator [Aurantimonas sp. MSK8Z-1]